MERKTKNMVLLGVAGVLLVLAMLLAFRDALFSKPPELSPEVQESIRAAQEPTPPAGSTPAPVPAGGEQPPSTFSRQARPVERPGGN